MSVRETSGPEPILLRYHSGPQHECVFIEGTPYRRVHDWSLAEAVERVQREMQKISAYWPTKETLRAAILGPAPEPEPEEWEKEAAKEWRDNRPTFPAGPGYVEALARHWAAARMRAGR